jgi:hypothetical protein
MSLPPDPHDDDLADPSPAPESLAPTAATPDTAAPPPPPPVADVPPPPPPPPVAASGSATGTGNAGGTGAELSTPTPSPSAGTGPAAGSPVPVAGSGRRRTGWIVGGVAAAVVVLAGAAVALGTGSSDGTEAAVSDEAPAGDVADDDLADDSTGATDPDDDGTGSAPSESDESPVEVTERFFAAVASGDCDELIGLMTPESYGSNGQTAEEAIDECEADAVGTAAVAAAEFDDVELVSEIGDEATVVVTMSVGNRVSESELPLRRVDGQWLMHLDTSPVPGVG